ncbi:hypothetical protein [Lentibacter sp.]
MARLAGEIKRHEEAFMPASQPQTSAPIGNQERPAPKAPVITDYASL